MQCERFMRVPRSLITSYISNINTLACVIDIIIACATNENGRIHYYTERRHIIAVQGAFVYDQQAEMQ